MDTLPRDLLPLTENQRWLLEDVVRGDIAAWASTQLKTRAIRLGLIAYDNERGLYLTPLGQAALTVDQEHGYSTHRRLLGHSPIRGGGSSYGLGLRCRCRWSKNTNESGAEGKRELMRAYRRHVEEILREKLG